MNERQLYKDNRVSFRLVQLRPGSDPVCGGSPVKTSTRPVSGFNSVWNLSRERVSFKVRRLRQQIFCRLFIKSDSQQRQNYSLHSLCWFKVVLLLRMTSKIYLKQSFCLITKCESSEFPEQQINRYSKKSSTAFTSEWHPKIYSSKAAASDVQI